MGRVLAGLTVAAVSLSASSCEFGGDNNPGLEGEMLGCRSVENLYHDGVSVITGEESDTNLSSHQEVGELVAAVQAEESQYEFDNDAYRFKNMSLAIIDPTSELRTSDLVNEPGEMGCFTEDSVYLLPGGMAVRAALFARDLAEA